MAKGRHYICVLLLWGVVVGLVSPRFCKFIALSCVNKCSDWTWAGVSCRGFHFFSKQTFWVKQEARLVTLLQALEGVFWIDLSQRVSANDARNDKNWEGEILLSQREPFIVWQESANLQLRSSIQWLVSFHLRPLNGVSLKGASWFL